MSKKSEYILSNGEVDFHDWRDYGVKMGWIDMPVCATHDWFKMSREEMDIYDEDGEVCIMASRYNEEKIASSQSGTN